jgi:hypothetical protein
MRNWNLLKEEQLIAELKVKLEKNRKEPFLSKEEKDKLIAEYKELNNKYDWYF